jgi:hypothetical protein
MSVSPPGLDRFQLGWLDLNQRSRASEARDHSRLVHVPKMTTAQVAQAIQHSASASYATGPIHERPRRDSNPHALAGTRLSTDGL